MLLSLAYSGGIKPYIYSLDANSICCGGSTEWLSKVSHVQNQFELVAVTLPRNVFEQATVVFTNPSFFTYIGEHLQSLHQNAAECEVL